MPSLIAALWGGFLSMIGTIVGRVLISLGIGYVAFRGIDTMVTAAKTSLFTSISSLPQAAVQLAGVLQVGTCVNIMASAVLARLAVAGLANGVLTKFVTKG